MRIILSIFLSKKIGSRGYGSTRRLLFAIFLLVAIGGAADARADDPARFIRRKCPVKMVNTDEEYQQAVLNGPEWTGGKVMIIGECTHDSKAIRSWAEAHGVKCRIASTAAYYGRRKIANGHWTVVPEGSSYTIDYVENIGVVTRRIREDDELVFYEASEHDSRIIASTRVVELPGTPRPVRSINFWEM